MAVSAGYAGKLYESASNTFSVEVTKVISVDITDAADMLDTSSIGAGQYKTSIQGMKQVNMTIQVNYDPSDTGQSALRSRYGDGAIVFVEVLYDGTNGHYWQFRVTEVSTPVAAGDLVTQTFTLEGQSTGTAVP